jgi:hypothetical protein
MVLRESMAAASACTRLVGPSDLCTAVPASPCSRTLSTPEQECDSYVMRAVARAGRASAEQHGGRGWREKVNLTSATVLGVLLLTGLSAAFFVLWITGAHLQPEAVGAVAGAAVSGLVAVVLAVLSSVERQRERQEREVEQRLERQERERSSTEEYLVRSFQYFVGGQQKRSIGISAIEGFSAEVPRLRGVFIPLLVNQVIYVLTKVPEDPADKILDDHEKDNLERMIELLGRFRGLAGFELYYARLDVQLAKKVARMQARIVAAEAASISGGGVPRDSTDATLLQTADWLDGLRTRLTSGAARRPASP